MTVRRKLVVALAAVALAVAALVGGIGYTLTRHVLQDEVNRSLGSAAATLSGGGTLTSAIEDYDHARRGGGGPGGWSGGDGDDDSIVQSAQTVSAAGAVAVAAGVPLPVSPAALAVASEPAGRQYLETVTVDGRDYRVLTQALGADRGMIQVARDLTQTEFVLSGLAWTTAGVGLAVLLAAAAAGWLIARQITRRLTALTAAAARFGDTGAVDPGALPTGADEVGRLGAAMQVMLGELARSRAEQQRLVQDAGHELRTPLTSLRTNVSVLERFDELSPASRHRLLADVRSETRELTDLVNELIELATDRHDGEQPGPVDLQAVAERVVERFRRRSGREIVLTVTDPVVIPGRPESVERAVSNLVDNAVKFGGDGPVEVVVDAATVEVGDRGPGIDPADLPHVFDRFYRSADARSLPGSGLGLAIVRDVALAHGGDVSVAGRPGGGTIVRLRLAPPAPSVPEPPAIG